MWPWHASVQHRALANVRFVDRHSLPSSHGGSRDRDSETTGLGCYSHANQETGVRWKARLRVGQFPIAAIATSIPTTAGWSPGRANGGQRSGRGSHMADRPRERWQAYHCLFDRIAKSLTHRLMLSIRSVCSCIGVLHRMAGEADRREAVRLELALRIQAGDTERSTCSVQPGTAVSSTCR